MRGTAVRGRDGGLTVQQIRRVTAHMHANLGRRVDCDELAYIAELSASHFIRAFHRSCGLPPHAYLVRCRIQRARSLLLTTDAPLGEIALACGFCDQAHFSRVFRRFVGATPAAWRRARAQ